jgi:hypothetical protein
MDESIYESIDEGEEDDLTASMLEDDEDEEYEGDEDEEQEGDEEEDVTSGRLTPPTQDTSAERAMGGNTPRRSAARA